MKNFEGEPILCPGCPARGSFCGPLKNSLEIIAVPRAAGDELVMAFEDEQVCQSVELTYTGDINPTVDEIKAGAEAIGEHLVEYRIGLCSGIAIRSTAEGGQEFYCPALVPEAVNDAVNSVIDNVIRRDNQLDLNT